MTGYQLDLRLGKKKRKEKVHVKNFGVGIPPEIAGGRAPCTRTNLCAFTRGQHDLSPGGQAN